MRIMTQEQPKLKNDIPFFDRIEPHQQYEMWDRNNLSERNDAGSYMKVYHEKMHWIDIYSGQYKRGILIFEHANPIITVHCIRNNKKSGHEINIPVFV